MLTCPAGMFLNTQNGSTILAACSRKELPMALPFAHRLWDVLVLNGASRAWKSGQQPPQLKVAQRTSHAPCSSGARAKYPAEWCWDINLHVLPDAVLFTPC